MQWCATNTQQTRTRGVDFGRDGCARYAFPGRDYRCAEERGSGCLPRVRIVCARKTVIPRTNNIDVYNPAFKSANSQEMLDLHRYQ